MKRGFADLPLHGGKAPKWLFERMKNLSREIIVYYVSEFGTKAFLEKISDPFWFQSLGCILGFDWHSSGLTTTVTGAIKEAIKEVGSDLGLFVAGGKGKTALKTPQEILEISDREGLNADRLIYASKMSAKVDNSAVQDGFQIYHHVIIFNKDGSWAVVQQGMNEKTGYARRYHWYSKKLQSFVLEPHTAICSDWKGRVLNMVAEGSKEVQDISVELARENPKNLEKEFRKILYLKMPTSHPIGLSYLKPESLRKVLLTTYEIQPKNYEALLGIKGVGPKTVRALALLSELIYGKSPSYEDPAKFSFAHGGKDGFPYPVDLKAYDKTIEILSRAVRSAKIEKQEKEKALKRVFRLVEKL